MSASLVGEKAMQPGEQRQVEVSIATAGRSGTIAKAVVVQTDHPDYAKVSLKVTVEVVVDLDFATPHVMFQNIAVGDRNEQEIQFVAADPGSVKFGDVSASGEGVKAKMSRTGTGASTAWVLRVVLSPKTAGPVSGNIQVALLEPEKKDLQILYSGVVKDAPAP